MLNAASQAAESLVQDNQQGLMELTEYLQQHETVSGKTLDLILTANSPGRNAHG